MQDPYSQPNEDHIAIILDTQYNVSKWHKVIVNEIGNRGFNYEDQFNSDNKNQLVSLELFHSMLL